MRTMRNMDVRNVCIFHNNTKLHEHDHAVKKIPPKKNERQLNYFN
jgi:hypothetical protein